MAQFSVGLKVGFSEDTVAGCSDGASVGRDAGTGDGCSNSAQAMWLQCSALVHARDDSLGSWLQGVFDPFF